MNILKAIGIAVAGILAIYAIWAAFIPMMIGGKAVEREVMQQSPQYVDSKRSAALKLYAEYKKADKGHKNAIKMQMCEELRDLPRSERPDEISLTCN